MKLIDRTILKALAVDAFAAAIGMAIVGLPIFFLHGVLA